MNSQLDPEPPPQYAAYLVRMWQETPQAPWRAFAQSVLTGEKIYFANLEALFAFLQAQTLNSGDEIPDTSIPSQELTSTRQTQARPRDFR